MEHLERVLELLAEPGTDALALALDPTTAAVVEMPAGIDISSDLVPDADGPLDLLTPDTQGQAVVAFEHARREGHGSAHVRRIEDGQPMWLEIADVTEPHGCLIAVLVRDDESEQSERQATTIAPRRCSYQLSAAAIIEGIDDDLTAMLGWSADDLIGESVMMLIHPDDHEAGIVAWIELLEQPGHATRLRQRFRTKDGNWVWCECTDHNLLDDASAPHVVAELIDVSREVAAEAALQRRETLLDRLYRALPTGVLVLDPDGSVATANDRWDELLSATPESENDRISLLLESVVDPDTVRESIDAATNAGADVDLEIDLLGSGPVRHADLHIRPIRERETHVGLLFTLDDSTERRTTADALSAQMRRDVLTGALNRRGVEEFLDDRLGGPIDVQERLTVLYLDLDGFKSVNDRRGHAVGDRVLRAVSESIRTTLSPSDVVARIGGDEFLAILTDPASDPERIVTMIRSDVDTMRFGEAAGTDLGVSVGRADRRPGDDFDSLIARADAAMYRDKRSSRRASDRPPPPVGSGDPRHADDAVGRLSAT